MNKLALVAIVLTLPGCFLFGQPKSRVACWDAADDHASDRIHGNPDKGIEAECEPNQTMAECPAWPDIEAELKANQERCE